MSSSDFLKAMKKAGEKYSAKPDFKTVGRMKVSFGYSGMVKGHSMMSLFKPFGNPADAESVSQEVSAHLVNLGGKPEAILGVLVKVPVDTILNFEAEWGFERLVNIGEKEDYETICDAIDKLDLPINEWFWCSYQTIESPTAVAKGESGKFKNRNSGEMVYPKIAIPVGKFDNEAAARAATGASGSTTDNTKWSDTVRKNFKNVQDFEKNISEIQMWYNKAIEGVPYFKDAENYPLPSPATPPKLKKYIADLYDCEPVDVDIALTMIPF